MLRRGLAAEANRTANGRNEGDGGVTTRPRTAGPGRAAWLVYAIILLAWAAFTYGFFWHRPTWSTFTLALKHSPLLAALLTGVAWRTKDRWWPRLSSALEMHTDAIDRIPVARLGLWVALAAGLGLYAELTIIRLHSSYFQLFAYFKNISLLSCFLGLGIGYMLGRRRPLLTPLVVPGIALQVLLMHFVYSSGMESALQTPVSEELAFGIRAGEGSGLLAAYGFLSLVFSFNALCFLPLGQLASRLMSRMPKLTAYGWNLAGSLAGIVLFNVLAYFWAPPTMWLLFVVLGSLLCLRQRPVALVVTAATGLVVLAALGVRSEPTELDVYSPYQKLTLDVRRNAPPELRVNHVYYQRLLGGEATAASDDHLLRTWQEHYDLPYHFKPSPGRVLVVGAGTGNDVAAAVRAGAGSIDAVEIDPAILEFGRLLHPDAPYQDPSVRAVVDDARAFIRHAEGGYDLIVYGLLDSHTLLSNKAGVRLDSYVYTVEAFREARARLADGGLISLTFSMIKPELGRKLFLMLEQAFDGERPIVYRTGYDEGLSFLIGEDMASREWGAYPGLTDVTEVLATSAVAADVSTDDWPFFYMPLRKYPSSYVMMILVLLAITLVFVRQTTPPESRGFSLPCFFLGAGFMLVETKGITELALVYGSTWAVTGIVIAGILVMAFLANLVVIRGGAPSPLVTYGLLAIALLAGMFVDSELLARLPAGAEGIALTGLLTLPLFFSGFAFSTELARAASVAVALSSNLLGAMLGGFLEYNSMYFGFDSLYLLAFAMYGLAFAGALRGAPSARVVLAPGATSA